MNKQEQDFLFDVAETLQDLTLSNNPYVNNMDMEILGESMQIRKNELRQLSDLMRNYIALARKDPMDRYDIHDAYDELNNIKERFKARLEKRKKNGKM